MRGHMYNTYGKENIKTLVVHSGIVDNLRHFLVSLLFIS